MRDHEVDEFVVGPFRVVEAGFVVGRAVLAQAFAGCDPHGPDQLHQPFAGRRRLQIFGDSGSSPFRLIMESTLREIPHFELQWRLSRHSPACPGPATANA